MEGKKLEIEKLIEFENRVSYHTYAGEVQSVRGVCFFCRKGRNTWQLLGNQDVENPLQAKTIMGLVMTPPGEYQRRKPGYLS